MTEHYVTLFDQAFLPQGLALYTSLTKFASPFRLWILCLDRDTFDFLRSHNFPHLSPISLTDYETPTLKQLSYERTPVEYCWTLTPFSILWLFQIDPSIERVTYLDADVFFLADPKPLFDEFNSSECSVLITEHDYSPKCDQTATSGRYCVQFLTIKRGEGETVLNWWCERCIEWCYARYEDGRFGDQSYLAGFVQYFPNQTFVLKGNGRLLAPWNADYYRYSDAILYHFHGLRVSNSNFILASKDRVLPPVRLHIYDPYIRLLQSLIAEYELAWIRPQISFTFKLRFKLALALLASFFVVFLGRMSTPLFYVSPVRR